jgi:type IV fimbrial biogenesis protein FimT
MTGKESGLTLLELLVVIAIAGILSSVSTPYFNGILIHIRSLSAGYSLRTALVLARSEAVKSRRVVRICPSEDGIVCSRALKWEIGWIIYTPEAGNIYREPGDNLIQSSGRHAGVQITKNGRESTIKFSPSGSIGLNRSFTVCTMDDKSPLFRLVLYRTGRIRMDYKRIDCV